MPSEERDMLLDTASVGRLPRRGPSCSVHVRALSAGDDGSERRPEVKKGE